MKLICRNYKMISPTEQMIQYGLPVPTRKSVRLFIYEFFIPEYNVDIKITINEDEDPIRKIKEMFKEDITN